MINIRRRRCGTRLSAYEISRMVEFNLTQETVGATGRDEPLPLCADTFMIVVGGMCFSLVVVVSPLSPRSEGACAMSARAHACVLGCVVCQYVMVWTLVCAVGGWRADRLCGVFFVDAFCVGLRLQTQQPLGFSGDPASDGGFVA